MLIARQRLDLLRDELKIFGKKLQTGNDGFVTLDHWFEAREFSDDEYLLRDIKGVTVGIFESIDLDFEVIDRSKDND